MDYKKHDETTTYSIIKRYNIMMDYEELKDEDQLKNFIVYCEHMLYSDNTEEVLKNHKTEHFYRTLYKVIDNINDVEMQQEEYGY